MEKWNIKSIDFDDEVKISIRKFIKDNPTFKKMLDERINDLINFPELFWASAVLDKENPDFAEFVTYHQQIDLAGYAKRKEGLAVVTHFEFHR